MQNISYLKQRISNKAFHKLTSQTVFVIFPDCKSQNGEEKEGDAIFLWVKRKDSSISRCLTALSSVEGDIMTADVMILGFRITSK